VVALAYPRVGPFFQSGPLEDEITSMIAGTVSPIMACFVIGTLTAYIVCFLNLLGSKVGRVLWGLSVVLLVFYGVGLGFYFKFGLKAEPAVQLALGEPQSYRQDLRIIVENQGNLPLELVSDHEVTNLFESPKKKSPAELERYQYMLVLQREGHDGVWEKAESSVSLGGGFWGSTEAFVEPGKKETFVSSVKPADEAPNYRVALLGANGAQMYSNAVTVEGLPEQTRVPSSTGIAQPPPKAPSEEEVAARSAVDELVKAALNTSLDRLGQMADETRQLIVKIDDTAVQNELLKRVDEVPARKAVDDLAKAAAHTHFEDLAKMADSTRELIYKIADSSLQNQLLAKVNDCLLPVVESSVRNDLNIAQTDANNGDLEYAEKRVRQAMDKYRTYMRMDTADLESQELYQQAQLLLQSIDQGLHPSRYYHVESILTIGDMSQAIVVDQEGVKYRVKEKDTFGLFVVEEIDRSKGVVLNRDGEVEVIGR